MLVVLRRVDGVPIPALLGRVHGHVRPAEQGVGIGAVIGVQRNADARLHVDGQPLDRERLLERAENRGRDARRARPVGARRQHRELVPAQPRHRVGRVQHAPQTRPHLLQDQVAVVVAERVVDLPKPVQVDEQQRERRARPGRDGPLQQVVEQGTVGQIGEAVVVGHSPYQLFRPPPLASSLRLAQLALDRRHQPGEIPLHDVVVRTGLHRGHRRLLADPARHDQERQVEPAGLEHGQRLGGAEVRHVVVGDHDLPRVLGERVAHGVRRVHAHRRRLVPAAPQLVDEEGRVVLGVFDDQDAERRARHRRPPRFGGGSLMTSQYSFNCRIASANWGKSTGLRM